MGGGTNCSGGTKLGPAAEEDATGEVRFFSFFSFFFFSSGVPVQGEAHVCE